MSEVDTGNNKVKENFIKDDITDFKKDIENMSKDGVDKIEEMNKVMDIVELILYFNTKDQQGGSLKILKPNQMLSRLPICLPQLKAGNNSEKLKNKIRHLLYSLYRSKKRTKNIYKNLVDIM